MKVRPSEVLFVRDELVAWSLDRAVVIFGLAVESDLDDHVSNEKNAKASKNKREQRFSVWMNTTPKFRDPASR